MAVALLALLAVLVVFVLAARQPPTITSLLPEADAVAYFDLRPVRLATHLDQNLPPRSPDYQQFVDSTGIVPERDLDQAAFAITARPDPDGPNGPVAWTEVLAGRFDAPRLEAYLRSLAASTELYAGHTVFVLTTALATPATATSPATPGRQLRLAVVAPGLLALSNAPTPEQIHAILDHSRSSPLSLPWLGSAAGPSVLAAHFGQVPRLSIAWAVGRAGLPFAEAGRLTLFGLELPVPADQPMVASLRYIGSVRLRIALLGRSPETALQQSGALSGLLVLARGFVANQSGHSPTPLLPALNSLHIAQRGSETVVTATLPLDLLRDLASNPPAH